MSWVGVPEHELGAIGSPQSATRAGAGRWSWGSTCNQLQVSYASSLTKVHFGLLAKRAFVS